MNDRKFNPLVAAAFAAACLAAASVHAEGIYVGGSLGTPHFGDNLNGVSGESSGLSGKFFGGYQLNSNFAIEGGYAKLGSINNSSGTVSAHGLYLDAVGLYPLGANFSLLGSVGLARVKLNTSNGNDKGMGLKVGVGAEYALSRSFSLRGEYESYRAAEFGGHPSIGQYTLGVRVGY